MVSYIHTAARGVESIGTLAGGNRLDQGILVRPAVDEVAVQAVPGGIAHGVHPAVEVGEGRGVVEELVENGVDSLRVRLWAHATIVGAEGGEGHLKS